MNHWQKHFGASRRAIDRKILAECEKTICQADLLALSPLGLYGPRPSGRS